MSLLMSGSKINYKYKLIKVDIPNVGELTAIKQSIVDVLAEYKATHFIDDVVIGMSGGVDSALTAALFKEAGWTVMVLHYQYTKNNQKQTEDKKPRGTWT